MEKQRGRRNFHFLFLLLVTNDLPLKCCRCGKLVVMETGSAVQGIGTQCVSLSCPADAPASADVREFL